jgi:hypothetical protein
MRWLWLFPVLFVPDQGLTEQDQTKFVFYAVLEGLYDDGADPKTMKRLLDEGPHFVDGCPICEPARHAIKVYVAAPNLWLKQPSRGFGTGLPKEIGEALAKDDRALRLKGLENLVARYAQARFDKLRFTDKERKEMQALLQSGKKLGMGALRQGFGDECPSCEGANRP